MLLVSLTGELKSARLVFIACSGTEVLGPTGMGFLLSGLMNKARFRVSREGCDRVMLSVSISSRRIAFFLLDPPLRVLGVLAGVFLPGVLRFGVFLPGVRRSRGLLRSDELTSFLCGKKLQKFWCKISV